MPVVVLLYYALSSYLLRGYQVAVNMTWVLFKLSNVEALEQVHTPVFGRFVRWSAHERSRYVQRDGRVSTWFERFQIGQCNLADYLAAVRHYIDLMGS